MSTALRIPNARSARSPARSSFRLSASELELRNQFVASFNDAPISDLALHSAVQDVTDELKDAGELPETVVKRIKYIAAIPIAFHYRVGYDGNRARLTDAVRKTISLSIARYFAGERG